MDKLQDILKRAAIKAPNKGFIVVNNSQKDIFVSYSELLDKANRIVYPKSVVRSAIIRGQVCNMLKISYLRNCFSNGGH